MAMIRKHALRSFVWRFFERSGYQIAQFVVQMVLARVLTSAEFGEIAILLVIINVANVTVQSGLNTALIRQKSIDDKDCSTVFWLCFGTAAVIYAILFVAAPLIAEFYDDIGLEAPLRVLALILFLYAFNAVQTAILMRRLETKSIFISTMASVVVSGASSIVMAQCDFGLWALVFQQLTYQLCSCVILHFRVCWTPRLEFSKRRAKEFYSFGWRVLCSGLLDTGYQGLYDLVVGRIYSTANLGYFSQGKKIPQALITVFDNSIRTVLLSVASKLQDDVTRVKSAARRSMMTSTFVIAPLMMLLALISPTLIVLVFGSQWIEAAPFMQILCIAYMFWPVHTSNLQVINALGRSDIVLRLEVAKKAMGVTILIAALVTMGNVYAVAYAKAIGSALSIFVNAKPSSKLIGYTYLEQLRDILPTYGVSVLACAIAFIPSMLGLTGILLMCVQIVLMTGSYLLISKAMRLESFRYSFSVFCEVMRGRVHR